MKIPTKDLLAPNLIYTETERHESRELVYSMRGGVFAPPVIDRMGGIFSNWKYQIDSYCSYKNFTDTPYVHSKKTILSSFVGAVYSTHDFALEEYGANKVDLYFSCSEQNEFYCKCSQKWNHPLTPVEKIIPKSIVKIADELKENPSSQALALTFWTPTFEHVDTIEDYSWSLERNLDDAIKNGIIDFYCLIKLERLHLFQLDDKKYYPCLVLVGKLL